MAIGKAYKAKQCPLELALKCLLLNRKRSEGFFLPPMHRFSSIHLFQLKVITTEHCHPLPIPIGLPQMPKFAEIRSLYLQHPKFPLKWDNM
jgi:hypothetical protein